MSDEEEGFVAGIRENPLDDLRRLVFADWLDERGRADEAEYLRLVAALADTFCEMKAERLLALGDQVDRNWSHDVGRRFDLFSDDPNAPADLVLTYGSGTNVAAGMTGMGSPHRYWVLPSTESSVRNLSPQLIVLEWVAKYNVSTDRVQTSISSTISALSHMKRLLLSTPEPACLVSHIPQQIHEAMSRFAITLQEDVPDLVAKRHVQVWRHRLQLTSSLDGEFTDPPFSGWIGVEARERSKELQS